GAGVTPWPVTLPRQTPGGVGSPRLEYEVSLVSAPSGGEVTVWAYLSPRNPALPTGGLRYGVSLDDGPIETVDINVGADDGLLNAVWARNTSDNVNATATRHSVTKAGVHRLRFWMGDPTVVVQRLVIDTGGLPALYLGPLESRRV
ncbi:glycosyl hydrolase, partial [Streptomyces sp. MBT65]|nr:glycosyl hydrolase [Streptomyces sp. MBT65]